MTARRHAAPGLKRGQAGPHRKAAANAFGHGHNIRRDACVLMRKKGSGTANTGLHLVKNQQQALLIAQFAQAAQTLGRHRAHPALTLNRLDQNGRSLRADHGF